MNLNEKELQTLLVLIGNVATTNYLDLRDYFSPELKGTHKLVDMLIQHEQAEKQDIAEIYEKLVVEYLNQVQYDEKTLLTYEEDFKWQGKIAVAINLIKLGIPIQTIKSAMGGLPEELIKKLKEL
ncbi:hypothetical protein [Bacillus sp. V5-8f]|uniref:hypothetical protein n=1 Tax=Bacillus sp. V5-8f TaxID=2053044 RepID=UPI000C77422E|nr:hypothetical protein [Bacillus sp. V5-8f]PLT32541.1 hypothetical protein CUU64_18745 [Bacillus sp. V5-8f]